MYYILEKESIIMADKELKPKSFRLDEETAEKFREISVAIGGNQQETLAKLIEAYEFQTSKAILVDKKGDIEQFEKYVSALTRMYMGTLEDNQNLTETIRTEFDALLKSKDNTIQDLQSKLTVSKQLKEEASSKARAHADENIRLNSVIDNLKKDYGIRLEDMETMLADKDNLNKALTDSCNSLKTKFEELKVAAAQTKELQEELNNLKKTYDEVTKEKAEIEKQLKEEQKKYSKDFENLKKELSFEKDKAVLELTRKYEEQMQKLKADRQSKIDKYQHKYFELLEQTKNQPI